MRRAVQVLEQGGRTPVGHLRLVEAGGIEQHVAHLGAALLAFACVGLWSGLAVPVKKPRGG